MIKKKPGRTHLTGKHEKRSLDALIYQNDSARQITWQQRVDEAVRGESDEFWEKVQCKVKFQTYIIHHFRLQKKLNKKASTKLMLSLKCSLTILWRKLRTVIKGYCGLLVGTSVNTQ